MKIVTLKQVINWRWWPRGASLHYTLPNGHRTRYGTRICYMEPVLKKLLASGCEVERYITFSIGHKRYGIDWHEFKT